MCNRKFTYLTIFFLFFLGLPSYGQATQAGEVKQFGLQYPEYVVSGQEVEVKVLALSPNNKPDSAIDQQATILIQGQSKSLQFSDGLARVKVLVESPEPVSFSTADGAFQQKMDIRVIPAWVSVLPALVAIFIALLFREVVSAIFGGIFVGAWVLKGLTFQGFFQALMSIIDTYVLGAMFSKDHLSIILFSVLIGGMVAVINRNGGMAGVVDKLSRFAKNSRSTQFMTYLLGLGIFFDDYANTLIVGNTMRPVNDKYKVSREKLAYIVDSTAAPVAATAFVTTWIGAELGYIRDAVQTLQLEESAYSLFLGSLQFAHYPIFCLVFMAMLILSGKDFGSMLKAENRARNTGVLGIRSKKPKTVEDLESSDALGPVPGLPARWYNAILPIITVLTVTFFGLIYTGLEASAQQIASAYSGSTWSNLHLLTDSEHISFVRKLGIILGNADAYTALLWSTLSGVLVAIALTQSQRLMPITETIESLIKGFETMVTPVLILVMAWSLATISEELYAADFLAGLFSTAVPPWMTPALTLLLAALVAFSTGSSWGTMAILYPLMLPTAYAIAQENGLAYDEIMFILYQVISAVLAGAVLGDHCSPISDTTILSSLASDCNHIQHVKTQLPYALTVAGVALFCSLVLLNLGLTWYITMIIGIVLLFLIVQFVGKEPDDPES